MKKVKKAGKDGGKKLPPWLMGKGGKDAKESKKVKKVK